MREKTYFILTEFIARSTIFFKKSLPIYKMYLFILHLFLLLYIRTLLLKKCKIIQ